MRPTFYIFDFDSTFTQVEAMEELAEISLANDPEKEVLIEKIKQLTDLAMDGSMPFGKSLKARIALLSAKKYHLNMLVNRLRKRVSTSFIRNKKFFKEEKENIYIVSGGFKEFIEPIVKAYFIEPDHVFANTFVYDKKNNIIGVDEENLLAQENGKVKLLKQLKLQGNVVMIGDGFTDYQVFEAKLAHHFYAYTENVSRQKVVQLAPQVAPSLDEILYKQKLPMSLSYPKSRIKVLLWGEACFMAENHFKEEGYQIQQLSIKANKTSFKEAIKDCQLLVFTPEARFDWVLNEPNKLLTAGVWGEIPTEKLQANWAEKGIALFGSNYAHTRSIAELALLMMLDLSRNLEEELQGKKLGIIGYGHSGSLLSVMAEQMGLEVLYYDIDEKPPLGNAKRTKQLSEVLRKSNLVVVVAGMRFDKQLLLGSKEIKQMQNSSILINLSYDERVDELVVMQALKSGKLAGFGMDQLTSVPILDKWKGLNVRLTYRKRLATKQTQINISDNLSERLISYVNTGSSKGSLSFPQMNLPALQQSHRFIHIHLNKPGVLAQINGLLAKHKLNISGQYLKTNEQIGYVITDVSKEYSEFVLEELRAIPETIKFRVLY
ncbi:MAG: HAD-IB family phosphatase [Bacteroidia bacterium]|nr:HAD-IB family phosphatase [Bacteroidia bacterium]